MRWNSRRLALSQNDLNFMLAAPEREWQNNFTQKAGDACGKQRSPLDKQYVD
jgi:hypothetical protein